MVNLLNEINLNIRSIKISSSDMVVGTNNGNSLAREQLKKMDGVGIFLTKISVLIKKWDFKKNGAWQDECD